MVFPIAGGTQSTGYDVSNSLRFHDGDSPDLRLALGSSPSGSNTNATFSFWIKRSEFDDQQILYNHYVDANNYFRINLRAIDAGTAPSGLEIVNIVGGSDAGSRMTNFRFRDSHAWYHIVVSTDSDNSTEDDRVKLYINGTRYTDWASTATWATTFKHFADNATVYIGTREGSSQYFDGYLSEVNVIDGTEYDATAFGEFNDNGVWIPKQYTGGYGNNGHFLEFKQTGTGTASASTIGADTSGNDKHFTSTNLSSFDVTVDTCTNNFATISNLYGDKQQGGAITFKEGNCQITTSYVDANYQRYPMAYSSMAVSKGKWYFEMKPISGNVYNIGVFSPEDFASDSTTNPYGGYAATGVIYTEGGVVRQNDTQDTGHATYDDSDIVGCALDMDNNAVYFHKNNTYINSGNPTSGASKTGAFTLPTTGSNGTDITLYGFTCGDEGAADIGTMQINFGNPPYAPSSIETDGNGRGSFEYAPPSGYLALCTKNLGSNG